ncbi:TPA: hypothetical protein N0F65_003459 [Lagenidium giganteum]|uniref:Amidohydrolase-related domain-containing protein n=1 Tax=Lagenidium giganteum TaxID=4803 RepID=A0AAV2YQ17_9STRA|nr:TPA: hypothetical protein N0F65_003459 [Lagenidium giganteum]
MAVNNIMHRSKGIDPELFAPPERATPPSNGGSRGGLGLNTPSPQLPGYGGIKGPGYGAYEPQHSNQGSGEHVSLELEHVSGYTGKGKNTIHAHPFDAESYIACMGAAVIIGNVHESHNQELLRAHDEEINVLCMSNSGAFVASAQMPSRRQQERGAAIVVWELSSRREMYELRGFQRPVLRMAFSPDDHFLAASAEDCRVILWDIRTSEVVLSKSFPAAVSIINWGRVEEKCRRPKYTMMFAYSSQLMMGELAYDISGMQYKLEVMPFNMPNVGLSRSYLCAAMTPTNTDVLAGTIAGELVIFNTDASVYRNTIPVSRNGVHSVVSCRATGFVYVGAGDGVLKKLVGNESDWNLVAQVQLVGGITGLSVSPSGSHLFAGTSAGKMYHIVANTLAPIELASSHLGSVTGCAFGDSCDEFATISVDGSVRVWDLSSYHLKSMATETVGGLTIAYSKKQAHPQLITGWADGWIRAYDTSTAQPRWHIANAHRGEVTSLATSDKYVVSGSADGGVSIWSIVSRELVLQFHEHKRSVSQVLVDVSKPHWVHSCGQDRALFIYDLKSQRRIVAQQVREGAFNGCTQRLDSETEIITAGSDGRMLFWDCDVADPVQVLVDPNRLRIACVSVSPSGRFLAACGEDCEVKLFDLRTMRLMSASIGHSEAVNYLSWSPDERQLVSVGSDACVCIWNVYQDDQSSKQTRPVLSSHCHWSFGSTMAKHVADLIITASHVIPVVPRGVVLRNYAIVIGNGRIMAILPQKDAVTQFPGAHVRELPNHIVLPGLVNAHTHAAMTLLRGLSDDKPLCDWLADDIWPAERKFADEDFVRDGCLHATAEMIRGGTTCCNDMYFHTATSAETFAQVGMRATVGIIRTAHAPELLAKYQGHELISMAVAPHAPYTKSEQVLQQFDVISMKHNLSFHTHVHETVAECHDSEHQIKTSMSCHKSDQRCRPLANFKRLGLLSERLICVHMTQLTDDEIDMVAEARTSVVHCPTSNLKLGSGICRVSDLLAKGINVAIGTDGAASNNGLNMFAEMKLAAILAKVATMKSTSVPAITALEMATLNGAKALGLSNEIGSIEVGKRADLTAITCDDIEMIPMYNAISHVVYAAGRELVSDVWINGQCVLRDRQLLTINEQQIKAIARKWQDLILDFHDHLQTKQPSDIHQDPATV